MDETNQDVPEVLETPEEQEEIVIEEEGTVPETDDEKEELRAKIAELESKNKQLFERAKKTKTEPLKETTLSPRDYLALNNARVSEEDIEEIQDFARYKGVSIADALKNPTLKTILNDRAEERKTAEVTTTRSSRGTAKTTGEDLLKRAERTGEVPDSVEGMENLFLARQARRFK